MPFFPKLKMIRDFKLDGWPYVFIWLLLANHRRLFRLFYLRLIGKNPSVILLSDESDGRFKRLFDQFWHIDEEIVFLNLPIGMFMFNEFFFQHFFKV